jgi:hypothetical protein
MNTTAYDFVTVDMRGLKAALEGRANAQRVSVSVLVRAAVARDLGLPLETELQKIVEPGDIASSAANVKLSIRMTPEEARQLAAGTRAAGLSRGTFLAGLIANVPVLLAGASRPDYIVALIASSAELSSVSRNINHLTALLHQGAFRAAQEYRPMLDTLGADLRAHLALTSRALADLQTKAARANSTALPINR